MDVVNFGLAEREPVRQVSMEEVEELCSTLKDTDEEESENPEETITVQDSEVLDEMAESD